MSCLEAAAVQPGLLSALLQVTNVAQEPPIRQAAAIQLKNQLVKQWDIGGAGSCAEAEKADAFESCI